MERWALSEWIVIVKDKYPEAVVINYLGSTAGKINGVLYEFYEKRMYNEAPLIRKTKDNKSS